MPALRLTKNMKMTLERLLIKVDVEQFVPFSTAVALERRNLARLGSQRTGNGCGLPEFALTLTPLGQKIAEQALKY
ncbi:MAG: hypothetical protein AB7G76_14340 [Steroidobacteraceae bacterium]